MKDPCAHCEEMMQPYMDRVLTDDERAEAESHLDECTYCRKRYRFEEHPDLSAEPTEPRQLEAQKGA